MPAEDLASGAFYKIDADAEGEEALVRLATETEAAALSAAELRILIEEQSGMVLVFCTSHGTLELACRGQFPPDSLVDSGDAMHWTAPTSPALTVNTCPPRVYVSRQGRNPA